MNVAVMSLNHTLKEVAAMAMARTNKCNWLDCVCSTSREKEDDAWIELQEVAGRSNKHSQQHYAVRLDDLTKWLSVYTEHARGPDT